MAHTFPRATSAVFILHITLTCCINIFLLWYSTWLTPSGILLLLFLLCLAVWIFFYFNIAPGSHLPKSCFAIYVVQCRIALILFLYWMWRISCTIFYLLSSHCVSISCYKYLLYLILLCIWPRYCEIQRLLLLVFTFLSHSRILLLLFLQYMGFIYHRVIFLLSLQYPQVADESSFIWFWSPNRDEGSRKSIG